MIDMREEAHAFLPCLTFLSHDMYARASRGPAVLLLCIFKRFDFISVFPFLLSFPLNPYIEIN